MWSKTKNTYLYPWKLKIMQNQALLKHKFDLSHTTTHPQPTPTHPQKALSGGPLGGGVPGPTEGRGRGYRARINDKLGPKSSNSYNFKVQLLGPIKGRFAAHYQPILARFWANLTANNLDLKNNNFALFRPLFSLFLSHLKPNSPPSGPKV